ncbi:MAG TPA: hypothetical protein VGL86_16595 [Polyangia bacterium]|jgi:hypothetical protein
MPDEKNAKSAPPSEDELVERADEEEDDRVAAEEASEIGNEDAGVVTDAREERIP